MATSSDSLAGGKIALHFASNRLLATFGPADRALIEGAAEAITLEKGQVLFESGRDMVATHFPAPGTMVSIAIDLEDGTSVEVASIGKEGAVGGIVSCGTAPAYGRAVVQIGGAALRVPMQALEGAKSRSSHIRELFCRYSDALLAQIMQSVACNAVHSLEARFCRWLLTSHDRAARDDLPLTQAYLAEMLGVQRTSVSGVARALQKEGLLSYSRGTVRILDRRRMEERACECYGAVESHYCRVLPDLRPQIVADAGAPST